ncbi:MAG TPA: helicase C-terminal domain-containing protein, partial [Thermoanaerobaculia bacterium]|nr:helicase C-terminal domain-containing protein [Thermoanaerobaculia bacterium]
MPPRFDDVRCRVELSVADLLERELAGSLGFGNRGGYERMWLGQAIHSRYQGDAEAADGTYRREVGVSLELVHRGWEVLLRGRIDGLRREPDGSLVVEEIKSVRRGGQLSAGARELYVRQALLYAWMLRAQQEAPVRVELVLIAIGSDQLERELLQPDWGELERELKRRLSALIRGHQQARAATAERRRIARDLAFPYADSRRGQEEIVAAADTALGNGDHLLIEAPTGIGKTVAALYPALRYALANDKRVFVLTAKTLQQDMAMRVLGLLNGEEGFRALRLRAKAKMCANGEVICHEEYCPFARDFYGKVKSSGIVPRLLAGTPQLEPEEIYRQAQAEEVCPFEISLDLSGQVQVVVCDYNYAFDPYVGLSDFGAGEDLADTILVIDELHNLVERGRGYYSPALSAAAARRVAEAMVRGGRPLLVELGELAEELARLVEVAVGDLLPGLHGEPGAAETALPEDALWALRPRFDAAFVDYLEYRREEKDFRAEDPFVALYFDVLRFLDAMMLVDDAFSTLAVRTLDDAQLQILCKDPSRFLGRVLNRTHAAIGLSATLSPVEFYRDLLGFDPQRTTWLSLPNPFPAENRLVVIDATVETTYRQRPLHTPRIASRLAEFAAAVPGNCLALFPSYEFLANVAAHLSVPGKRVLVQQRSDSDRARQEILDTLRGALLRDVLLLAVAGGVFAEGVDYPGDML